MIFLQTNQNHHNCKCLLLPISYSILGALRNSYIVKICSYLIIPMLSGCYLPSMSLKASSDGSAGSRVGLAGEPPLAVSMVTAALPGESV